MRTRYVYRDVAIRNSLRSNNCLLLFWSRLVHADLAIHATLAALGTLPALCPCEPLGPVGDMQAVSYGARSTQYSPLLPASSS